MEFLGGIPYFEKVLFWIAVPSTIMLVFQAVFTFIGMEGYSNDLPEINSDSSPAEFSMDGHFPILTIRNVIIFFSVFGWCALAIKKIGGNDIVAIVISILVAIVVIIFVSYTFYFINKLSEDNTVNIENAIGAKGSVYLKIPANKSGSGKIQVVYQGAQRELEAMTEGEELETGSLIKVIEIIDEKLVLVEKI